MKKYISAYHSISGLNGLSLEKAKRHDTRLQLVEPAYADLIDVRLMRRMSKFLKMGVYTAMSCLKENDTPKVEGFISATGLGCIADTQLFLNNMIQREEYLLNPTSFIQSTHNTLAGTLGIMTGNNCYNNTWSQRGLSFTCAIEDAMLKKASGDAGSLVIAADEMPDSIQELLLQIPGCPVQIGWTEGAASFLIHHDTTTTGNIELTMETIPTKGNESMGTFDSSDNILLINTNESVGNELISGERIDFTKIMGRCFINDALALAWACDVLHDKANDHQIAWVLGGDDIHTTIFKLRLT